MVFGESSDWHGLPDKTEVDIIAFLWLGARRGGRGGLVSLFRGLLAQDSS